MTSTRTGHELLSLQKPPSGTLHVTSNFPLVRIDAGYMQCCGSGMFIPDPNFSFPDPNFFHPGSLIRIFSIPDPGSASKN
jgi:hypothetical protein